jgi:EAL domain-containing protein (putative c-di-GMP-specific phosphodiesterase class I)
MAAMSAVALVPSGAASAGLLDRDLKADRDRFVAFAFAFADLLVEVGADGRVRFAVGAARALTGRDPGALEDTPFVTLFDAADRAGAERLVASCRGGNRMEALTLRLAGSGLAASVSSCGLPGRHDAVYVAIAHRRAHALDAAQHRRDPASGLLEPESFTNAAAEALESARALRQDVQLTLVRLCGVDALRARGGDGAVDGLFAEIGSFLNAHAVRGAAGRIGADRCGVVHAAETQLDVAGETAHVLRAQGHPPDLVSVDGTTMDLMDEGLGPADAAKALTFALRRFADNDSFEAASLADAFRTLVDETVGRVVRLKEVVQDERFEVAFQPIVRLGDGRVEHYELLARLEPGRSPLEMIRFAEGIGMIEEFDLSVCGRAVAHLCAPSAGKRRMPVAVNLSGGSLQSAAFMKALLALLVRAQVPRGKLLFEVTESAQIGNLAPVRDFVEELRRMGHRVCLDDFGAGAASFSYLQALPVDFVKIDGAYIGRLCDSARDRAIVKAIAAMCRDLGIRTIAEMIERESQLDQLLELGVELGQGFLFDFPQRRPTLGA